MDLESTKVGIVKCLDYRDESLADALNTLTNACPLPGNLRSSHIVIKPNLISARRSPLACTDGRFILAVVRYFLDRGARVKVGDSPAFGTAEAVLARIGILDALKGMAIKVVDFGRSETVCLPSGLKVGLAAEALHCDTLVNLPRVKAHVQLRVTLAVKNFFGCVAGLRKPCWHMQYGGKSGRFFHHLVELLTVLPQSITFTDGIVAMHKTGPIGGDPFDLGIVACSTNPVALDRSLIEIIGLASDASPLMVACSDAGLTGCDLEKLVFPLLEPQEVKVQNFKFPDFLEPVRFRPDRFLFSSVKRIILQRKSSI